MRLLTLNIGGPSLERGERLLAFLDGMNPDVLVLTETRCNRGTGQLLSGLSAKGYRVVFPTDMPTGERGVAIAHRCREGVVVDLRTADLQHRLVAVELELPSPVTVLGAYVPSRDASDVKITRKQLFLHQMGDLVRRASTRGQPLILMGDLNVIARDHVPRYSAFRAWEYDALENILGCGLVDAFTERNPGHQAHSWIGRTGSGYRYDYAFVSLGLVPRMARCDYLHTPREQRLTDHAAVQLTMTDVAP